MVMHGSVQDDDRAYLFEGLVTVGTLVRLLSCVYALVLSQLCVPSTAHPPTHQSIA